MFAGAEEDFQGPAVHIGRSSFIKSRPTIAHYVEECPPVSFPIVVISGSMRVGVPNEEVINETRKTLSFEQGGVP